MRDIIITLIMLGGIPYILKRPHIGVMFWSWISYMNPHRLTWGFAYSLPFAALIGAATLIGFVFSREPKSIPWNAITVILLCFVLWTSITTPFALLGEEARSEWGRFMKVQLFTFITFAVITNRERLHQLIWVVVASIGFYGVKGGFFTVMTGGKHHVLGPEGSFFEPNNELAFTLVLIFPFMRYLQLNTNSKWVKYAFSVAMLLTVFSVLGSYSRGALLAIACMGAFMIMKSRKKVLIIAVAVLLVPIALSFMPEKWHTRMDTIETYEEDRSAMGRINAWKIGVEIALSRPLVGGGFNAFDRRIYPLYLPKGIDPNVDAIAGDVHSSYFEVLGEQGFPGLFLFLALLYTTFRYSSKVIMMTKDKPDLSWASDLASMVQVSLIGYAVGGAFLGMAYFDLLYTIIAFIVCLHTMIEKEYSDQLKIS